MFWRVFFVMFFFYFRVRAKILDILQPGKRMVRQSTARPWSIPPEVYVRNTRILTVSGLAVAGAGTFSLIPRRLRISLGTNSDLFSDL